MYPAPNFRGVHILPLSKWGREGYMYSTNNIGTLLCVEVCSLIYYSLSKYSREYASLLSHDFRIFTSLGE